MRVVSWNIRGLKDDRAAVVRTLVALEPDVVAVQEPPRGPFGRRRLAGLAQDAGLEIGVAGPRAATTAILVRSGLPVSQRRTMKLPTRLGTTRRGLAFVEIAGVRYLSIHLGLSPNRRRRHMLRVATVLSATRGPAVVAGDFNEPPGGPSRHRLALHLRDVTAGRGPTFGDRAIDGILASGDLVASGARVNDDEDVRGASDHRPVVVDLTPR